MSNPFLCFHLVILMFGGVSYVRMKRRTGGTSGTRTCIWLKCTTNSQKRENTPIHWGWTSLVTGWVWSLRLVELGPLKLAPKHKGVNVCDWSGNFLCVPSILSRQTSVLVVLEPIPAVITMDRSPVYTGQTYRDRQTFTLAFTPLYNLESPGNREGRRIVLSWAQPGVSTDQHVVEKNTLLFDFFQTSSFKAETWHII